MTESITIYPGSAPQKEIPVLIDYWTIVETENLEVICIMECTTEMSTLDESLIVSKELGRHLFDWFWGKEISKAEFETYLAFGIREIKP